VNLAQPGRNTPYAVTSSGSNGAAPIQVEAQIFGAWTKSWSQSFAEGIDTAAGAGTTAGVGCAVASGNRDTLCTVTAWDTQTGQVKWSTSISHGIPADNKAIAVTVEGSFIAVAMTEFTPPLPSASFRTVLRTFSTHTGTPLHVYQAANQTQARDVAIGANVVAVVSLESVDIFSVISGSVAYSHQFDFSTGVMCLSENGQYYAYGFEQLFLYERVSNEMWSQVDMLSYGAGGQQFFAGTCSLSKQGTTLAVGWYRSDFIQNAVTSYDTTTKVANYQYNYPTDTGSIYQNLPVDSQFDSTGRHFVVGSWGSSNGTSPTVALFRSTGPASNPLAASYTTTGSVFSVSALTDARNGNVYAACAAKAVHANKMGDGGYFGVFQATAP
jgi:hypothetical protein